MITIERFRRARPDMMTGQERFNRGRLRSAGLDLSVSKVHKLLIIYISAH